MIVLAKTANPYIACRLHSLIIILSVAIVNTDMCSLDSTDGPDSIAFNIPIPILIMGM